MFCKHTSRDFHPPPSVLDEQSAGAPSGGWQQSRVIITLVISMAWLGGPVVLPAIVDAEVGGNELRSDKDCACCGEIETDDPSDGEGDGSKSGKKKED
jgi:hypothetical protein